MHLYPAQGLTATTPRASLYRSPAQPRKIYRTVPKSIPARVLIATHTRGLAETLAESIASAAYAVTQLDTPSAEDLATALPTRLAEENPTLVLIELKQNTDALARIRAQSPGTLVVVMLTTAQPELAFQASRLGADAMLLLSNSDEEVADAVAHTLAHPRTPSQPLATPHQAAVVETRTAAQSEHPLFGQHPHMAEIRETIAKVATTSATVLIRGESGVGKEIVARMIFARSPRADKPFVKVNCAAIPHDLLESELFGYEKGAFTGALQRKIGLAEAAHGGTLFLDEIGEVPLAMQVKLLRLIESGSFRPVGSLRTVHSDFRLVCATHKPLKDMVSAGSFRQDLFYRISAFPIRLPALRERSDDLPLLIDSLLQRLAPTAVPRIDPLAMKALGLHDWPGNIRELRNVLERARLFTDDGVIRVVDLPAELRRETAATTPQRRRGRNELEQLAHALAMFDGSRSELAKTLGMSERTLYRRLQALEGKA